MQRMFLSLYQDRIDPRSMNVLLVQADPVSFALLLFMVVVLLLQIGGKTLHQQDDHNSLYCRGLDPNRQCL